MTSRTREVRGDTPMLNRLFAGLRRPTTVIAIAVLLLPLLPIEIAAQGGGFYQQKNLVSDLPNLAAVRDKSLVNPWGLSHSPNGPWQVSTMAQASPRSTQV